ncbi:hypothetical protein D3C80_2055470 [compost metagenome]
MDRAGNNDVPCIYVGFHDTLFPDDHISRTFHIPVDGAFNPHTCLGADFSFEYTALTDDRIHGIGVGSCRFLFAEHGYSSFRVPFR